MHYTKSFFCSIILCSFLQNTTLHAATKSEKSNVLHTEWMDKSISPAQDFYRFANAIWQKNNPIPAEYSSWNVFNVLTQKVQERTRKIIIAAEKNQHAIPGSIEQKIGDFYFSGMDEKTINTLGAKPLHDEFSKIHQLQSKNELTTLIAHLHWIGVDAFFSLNNMQDFKNSEDMIANLDQGGIGLPNRDYYLKKDPEFQKIREAYLVFIAKTFELLGDNDSQAKTNAEIVMNLETSLAKASKSPVELRDPYGIYNIKTIAQLEKISPGFSWKSYLTAMKQENLKSLNVSNPNFFKTVNEVINNLPLDKIKVYLRWCLIGTYSSYLSQPFVDNNFKMSSILSGTKKLLPRWKRVVATETGLLGFAIGKIYVEKYFPPQSKQEVQNIVKNIRVELENDIKNLKWMGADTKKQALNKLNLMEARIGYPDKWRDYTALKIDRGPYVLNVMRGNYFLITRELNKIGKPLDRSEWVMVPQIINAYYDVSMNNLNMPAGILQAPFYDPKAPAAVNYGAIGFVIGHEMTHGFDDQGAQFDGKGTLHKWWTDQDYKKFKKSTQCIIDQFSNYKVNGNLPLQGGLIVGEASADLAGLRLAYKAFSSSKEYKKAKTIDGFTPEQQFFISAAHAWANNSRPEYLRNLVTTDSHPPAMYRVNGTLANMPEFQKAFAIPLNSPMMSKERCEIW